MTIRTFFYIFLIISIIITKANSFAEWLANQYCDRQLIVGEVIMNQEVELNNNRKVLVYRNDIELQSGSEYILGEILTISITEIEKKNQFMFETSNNAKFENGGCDGLRSAKPKPNLILPNKLDNNNDNKVTIVSGWAYGHETVYVTEPFILNPPTTVNNNNNENIKNENIKNENIKNENIKNENIKNENIKNENIKNDNIIPKKVKSHPKIVPKTPSSPSSPSIKKKSINSTRKNLMRAQHEEDIAIRLDTIKKTRANINEGIGNKDTNEPKISKEKLEEIISKNKKDITEHWKKIKADIKSSTGIKNSEEKHAAKKAKKEKKLKNFKKIKTKLRGGSSDHQMIVSFIEYFLVVVAMTYVSYKVVKERFKIFRYYLKFRGRNVDK